MVYISSMWINRHLTLIFYKPLFIPNLAFSLIALRFLANNGWGTIFVSIIIKLVGYAAVLGYQYYFSPKVYFYYRNAGMPLRKVYGYTFCFDFMIYSLMMIIYYLASL